MTTWRRHSNAGASSLVSQLYASRINNTTTLSLVMCADYNFHVPVFNSIVIFFAFFRYALTNMLARMFVLFRDWQDFCNIFSLAVFNLFISQIYSLAFYLFRLINLGISLSYWRQLLMISGALRKYVWRRIAVIGIEFRNAAWAHHYEIRDRRESGALAVTLACNLDIVICKRHLSVPTFANIVTSQFHVWRKVLYLPTAQMSHGHFGNGVEAFQASKCGKCDNYNPK